MKKIVLSLIIFLSSLLFSTNVKASNFEVSIIGNDTFENEITLYLKVDKLDGFNGVCNGLCGLVVDLNYDTSKIELTSIGSLEDFNLTHDKSIVLYKENGVDSGSKILKMKFRNKLLFNGETTTIIFSNIVASDGDKDIKANDTSKVIKLVSKKSTTTNTSNKNNEIKKSSNNYLSSIILSDGNIIFDKNVLTYDIVVDYKTIDIEIKAIAENSNATIIGDGKHQLKVGSNIIKIIIKAEDKTERIYTININREAKDTEIKDDNKNKDDTYKAEIDNTTKKESNFIIYFIIVTIIIMIVLVIRKKQR